MLNRLKNSIKDKFVAVKILFNRNKFIFIASAVAAALGIILAITGLGKATEKYSYGNVITKISSGEFNFLLFYFKLLFFTSLFYIVSLLTTFNFLVFLINFPILLFYAKFFMRAVFVSCVLDGFTGILLLIILYMPLFFVNWVLFTIYLAELFQVVGYGCKLKYITPLKCYWNSTRMLLKIYLLKSILFNIVYSAIILIILAIIF